MKYFLPIISCLLLSAVYGQKTVNTTKTDQHQQVPGTKFLLIPPNGFINATSFQGFQRVAGQAFIMTSEIPGPFSEVAKGLTAEGLKTQGMFLKTKELVRINELDGVYMTAEQLANGMAYTKHLLVFGNEQMTCMLTGIYLKDDQSVDSSIVKSLFTVIYDADVSADPVEAASFRIDTEGTKLQFAKSMSGTLLYSTDGNIPTQSADKTNFIVGLSFGEIEIIDRKRTALDRIKKLPYKDMKVEEQHIREISIDSISGYEIYGKGINLKSGMPDLVYQVMLFTDHGYYLMVGTAKDDFDENLTLFEKLARTFRRK